jgi:hypothetical protein
VYCTSAEARPQYQLNDYKHQLLFSTREGCLFLGCGVCRKLRCACTQRAMQCKTQALALSGTKQMVSSMHRMQALWSACLACAAQAAASSRRFPFQQLLLSALCHAHPVSLALSRLLGRLHGANHSVLRLRAAAASKDGSNKVKMRTLKQQKSLTAGSCGC